MKGHCSVGLSCFERSLPALEEEHLAPQGAHSVEDHGGVAGVGGGGWRGFIWDHDDVRTWFNENHQSRNKQDAETFLNIISYNR